MFAILAVLCTGLFAGAALYVTLVEHPARIECGTMLALTEFAPSYRRAATMQAALAIGGGAASVLAWLLGGGAAILVGGLLLGGLVPFTLLVVYPVNARLLDPTLDPASPVARALLVQWARLHAVRTVVSIVAFVIELAGRAS